MKHLKAQIKAIEHELAEHRKEFSANAQSLRIEVGKPGVLLKGFLVGFMIGYFILPNKKAKAAHHLEQNPEQHPETAHEPHWSKHLAFALQQYFPSNNLLANVAKILKFL